jgi:peptidoglycan/LPS O-acetylase OafA/YrhL
MQARNSPSITIVKGRRASDHLDFIRGLSALVVVIYHVRYRFFLDYVDVPERDFTTRFFYSITAFGHDAVMVFFVLSGFFICGSILGDRMSGRWEWRRYLLNRMVRLYVVLLPAIVLTLSVDSIGLRFFGSHVAYTGLAQDWRHDFFNVADRLSANITLGNLTFLQTILVTPLGSNDALWSLSFEFWYYLLFPMLWIAVSSGTSGMLRLGLLAAAVLGLLFVGRTIALYFGIWLMGAFLAILPRPSWRAFTSLATLGSLALFVATVVAVHLPSVRSLLGGSLAAADYATAISFATFVYFLTCDRSPSKAGLYRTMAKHFAGCSYTLYAVHLPILVLLRGAFTADRGWSPNGGTIAVAFILTATVVVFAFVLAQATEARTSYFRTRVSRALGGL